MAGTAFSAANWSGYDAASFTSGADLTDWSPPISIANFSASWKAAVQSDGADIRITKSDGTTELPYALIGWAYNAGSPTGLIRVKFSGSSGTSANTVRVYAGYTPGTATAYDANETYGSDNAFASHWKGYWADGGGTDWTSNDNDGAAQGGVTFGGATGKIGPGTDYNGTDQYSVITDDAALQVQSGTIMGWCASSLSNSWEALFARYETAGGGYAALRRGTSDDMSIRHSDGVNNTNVTIEARGGTLSSTLQHYRCEFSLTDCEVFENDSSVGTDSDTIPSYTDPALNATIGYSALSGYWDGIICEVQLHSPQVSDAWVDEEYSATNDNASYWTSWSWTSATPAAPTVSSATINTAGDTLTVVFSESVTGQTGWTVRASYAYCGITASSGNGTDTHTFTLSREAIDGERLWLMYDPTAGNAVNGGAVEVEEIGWREQSIANNSTYTITRPSLPTYLGDKKITGLTTITPVITCTRASGAEPMYVQVSAEQTTADAGSRPYFDLHFEWDFGDSGGTEEMTNYFTGATINMNDGQRGPEAAYVYRTAGDYTITLTVKGIDGSGQSVSASTTTIIRLGEWEVFNGGGTGGTFTLTCEVDSDGGETTSAIAYDATIADVVTALEALSNVPAGTMRDTGYGTIEAVGSLAGADVVFTFNSSITGAGTGDAAPAMIERWAPESESDITVTSTSGWTQVYFDSEAAGGGDGSSGSPYNSATELREQFHSSFDGDRSNVVCNIAAGSDFTLPNAWKFSEQNTGWRFKKWGSGADPIIRDSVSASGNYSLLYAEFPYAPSTSELLLSDIVFSNIDFRCNTTGDLGALLFTPTTNGNTAHPHVWFAFGLIDNCSFTREAGSNQLVRINDELYAQSFMLWNTHLNAGPFPTLASYGCNVSQWAGACGGSFAGVDAEGSLLDHHIYPKMFGHSLFSCIGFEDGFDGTNTCLNLTAAGADSQVSKFHLMYGCNITGTQNGMDLANEWSDYDDGLTRLGDVLVLCCLIHSGRIADQENGVIAPNITSLCVRYCDLWDNLDKGIVTSDLVYLEDYRVEFVNSYADGPGIFIRTDNAKLFGNKIYSTDATNAAQQWYSNDCDITTADADHNTYYAPNSTEPFVDRDGSDVSFATWQSYGHDANGSEADPNFSDPDHGVMNYTYATPSYDGDTTAPTVSSATINSLGTTYTIVYSEAVTGQTGHTLSATGGAVTLTPSSGDTTDTHVWSLDRTILKPETVTRSYSPGNAQDAVGNTLDAYSGQAVTNGSGMPRPTVSTAAIATAGNAMTLTFAENVTGQLGWLLTATDGAVTATGSSGDGTASHGFSLSRVIGDHETVTLAYDSATGNAVDDDGLEVADFSGLEVDNDSTQDTVDPELSTATISLDGLTLTLVFTEAVTGQTAFTITASGGAATLSSPTGDGTGTFTFTINRAIDSTEVVTLDYDSVTGTTQDAAGNTLATITDQPVTILQGGNDVAGTLIAIGVL
jgi:hypothetical protein